MGVKMSTPRLIVAAPQSGSGKTTIAVGLMAALRRRGLTVAAFKVGPDYIDPSYHGLAVDGAGHNLDSWMLTPSQVTASFCRRSQNADVAVVEGMMGLFDGISGIDDTGSAAHIARLLAAPVLLVIDASALARSGAALVQGFRDFDLRVKLAGVLLNRVGGPGHAQMVADAIESAVGLPVLGYLPDDAQLRLPERHLGLIPVAEAERRAWVDRAREQVEQSVDVERILAVARLAQREGIVGKDSFDPFAPQQPTPVARIAVAQDAAFNFVYADNLDLLRAAGAEIVFFSPLADPALPPGTEAVYLCGGFPEIYAQRLAENHSLLLAMRRAAADGMPIYAECGGLMWLADAIVDGEGARHGMAGVLPGASVMTPRLTIGYRTAKARVDSWLWRAGEEVRGHEFHHSVWEGRPATSEAAYEFQPGAIQPESLLDGVVQGNVVASYLHLHFLALPVLAERFVRAAAKWAATGSSQ